MLDNSVILVPFVPLLGFGIELPWSVGYLVFLTISTGIFAIFGLGLNLQWGFTGLINFGHVAFLALGAYATMLLSDIGVPIPFAVLAGMLLASTLGLLVGMSTLRLREDYLAIVTIGVAEVVRLIILNEEWLTRGAFGVQGYPLPGADLDPNFFARGATIALLWVVIGAAIAQMWWRLARAWRTQQDIKQRLPIGSIVWAAFGTLAGAIIGLNGAVALWDYDYKAGLMLQIVVALAVVYGGLELLVRSPWGRVLKAIREDEEIPRALGKNVFWYKLQAFMVGGAISGFAGSFFAWQLTAVYPDSFRPLVSFYAWTIVVLGGAGNNAGVLLGAVIFWAYDSLTRFAFQDVGFFDESQLGALRILIIGLILMILTIWRPQGILGKKEELTLGR